MHKKEEAVLLASFREMAKKDRIFVLSLVRSLNAQSKFGLPPPKIPAK